MKIKIEELKQLAENVLKNKGVKEEDIPSIIDEYLDGELRGRKCHGFSSFPKFCIKKLDSYGKEYIIEKEDDSFLIINGNGGLGQVIMPKLFPKIIETKSSYGEILSVPLTMTMVLWLSLILIFISSIFLILNRFWLAAPVTLFTSLIIFVAVLYFFSDITLGGIWGKGVIEGNKASWGLGYGFYISLLTLILIVLKKIYVIRGRSNET